MQEPELLKALQDRDIIDILIGDESDIFPYKKGWELETLCNELGLEIEYDKRSRWQYMKELMGFCYEQDKIPELFEKILAKKNFGKTLKNSNDIKKESKEIVDKAINEINKKLFLEDYELVKINQKYLIKPINQSIDIISPNFDEIDNEYIKGVSEKALKDIKNEEFDDALTKARTLVEEVFIYVLERKDIEPKSKGDIGKLYKQVKDEYNMHTDKNIDNSINTLLSGLEKIITGISSMRNLNSSAHGRGSQRVKNIKDYHTKLVVNSSIVLSEFIISVYKESCLDVR